MSDLINVILIAIILLMLVGMPLGFILFLWIYRKKRREAAKIYGREEEPKPKRVKRRFFRKKHRPDERRDSDDENKEDTGEERRVQLLSPRSDDNVERNPKKDWPSFS